jgi:hypothetical protein
MKYVEVEVPFELQKFFGTINFKTLFKSQNLTDVEKCLQAKG